MTAAGQESESELRLTALAKLYLSQDRNPSSHSDISGLLSQRDFRKLSLHLSSRLGFGTAGLRGLSTGPSGELLGGWNVMNDLVVLQTSLGLARYIRGQESKGVVIAFDGRHHARRFARLAANVFVRLRFKVWLVAQPAITPLVPFAIQRYAARVGVMVTASHNPAKDQGYDANAVQIIPPVDANVQSHIMQSLDVPVEMWDLSTLDASPLMQPVDDLFPAYISVAASSIRIPNPTSERIVHTSLHGTADKFVSAAFSAAGIQSYIPTVEQQHPDPKFPTVEYPNPEEGAGALKLAYETADKCNANYILANDPDCDRFMACERGVDGEWRAFNGNEMGILLAYNALRSYKETGRPIEKLAFISTTVSSTLLSIMAEKEGFKFAESLTGFKWVGNEAIKLRSEGYEPTFGYEEAIGYAVGMGVLDKDGVTAALAFVQMLSILREKNITVASHLDQLYKRYGNVISADSYYISNDAATINGIFKSLRSNERSKSVRAIGDYPSQLGPFIVQRVRDMTEYWDSSTDDLKPSLPFTGDQMITFFGKSAEVTDNETSFKLTIRTSGTEPKIKYYLQAAGRVSRPQLQAMLEKAASDLDNNWIDVKRWAIRKKS